MAQGGVVRPRVFRLAQVGVLQSRLAQGHGKAQDSD